MKKVYLTTACFCILISISIQALAQPLRYQVLAIADNFDAVFDYEIGPLKILMSFEEAKTKMESEGFRVSVLQSPTLSFPKGLFNFVRTDSKNVINGQVVFRDGHINTLSHTIRYITQRNIDFVAFKAEKEAELESLFGIPKEGQFCEFKPSKRNPILNDRLNCSFVALASRNGRRSTIKASYHNRGANIDLIYRG